MLVVFSWKKDGKLSTKSAGTIKDNGDNGFNFLSSGLRVVCFVEAFEPEKSATQAMLTKLLAEHSKHAVCRYITANVGIFGSCYSYNRLGI